MFFEGDFSAGEKVKSKSSEITDEIVIDEVEIDEI